MTCSRENFPNRCFVFLALGLYLIFLLASCRFKNIYNIYVNEFDNHISNADSIVFDKDPLHPTYAYLKNGKVIGIKSNANPECGEYSKRYFVNNNELVDKIVIMKDFYNESCREKYDSTYIIEPMKNSIIVSTKNSVGKEIENNEMIKHEKMNLKKYYIEISKWKRVMDGKKSTIF